MGRREAIITYEDRCDNCCMVDGIDREGPLYDCSNCPNEVCGPCLNECNICSKTFCWECYKVSSISDDIFYCILCIKKDSGLITRDIGEDPIEET